MRKHLGVRYVYDEFTASFSLTKTETNLHPAALATLTEGIAALSPDSVASLHRAIIECDLDLILTYIAQICEQNEPLANALADLAKNFRFEELLNLTQPRASEL